MKNTLKLEIVKTIKSELSENNNVICFENYDITFFDDKVVLSTGLHKKLFSKALSENNSSPWKRGIISINCNGNYIYRLYYGSNKVKESEVGLNLFNHSLLGISKENKVVKFKIQPSTRLKFYWNHPNHTVRSAFKLGFISLILALISVLLGVLAIYLTL